jgi:hypothetical protein
VTTTTTTAIRGWVSKLLPQPSPDSQNVDAGVRLGRYGEHMVVLVTPTSDIADAEEGSTIIARTPTIGTGAIFTAASTSFADVNPQMYLFNGENPSDPNAKTIALRMLKFLTTAAATGVTGGLHYAFQVDPIRRSFTTNNFDWFGSGQQSTVGPPKVYNANLQSALPAGMVFGYQAVAATASVATASSPQSVVVSRGTFGGLNQAGDVLQVNFGQYDSGSAPALTAAEAAGQQGSRVSCEPAVLIPPGCTLTGYFWGATMSASFAPEITLVLRAR